MAHSIEMTSTDDQIPLFPQTEKDEIKEGLEVDHSVDIKDTHNDQDPSGSQTKKSVNQLFGEKFEDLVNSSIKSFTIFKVNVWLREANRDAYTPKMVSIGPYHKKNPQLDAMEKYKLSYLQRFLQRKVGLDAESCIKELEELKEEAIKCYEDIKDDDQFCEMLLLDGCFVVEFIREFYSGIRPKEEDRIINDNIGGYIYRDLMLLENQLPFFVLNKLHHMTLQDNELPIAIPVINSFLSFVDKPEITHESFREIARPNINHLLHLAHILSCHGKNRTPISTDKTEWHMLMPNATELSEAGVEFRKVSATTSLFDIKFENGLMKIPPFKVEDTTESLLRNLIAYEQQSHHVFPTYFSDFAIFMDHLIESDKDVNLLRQNEIIVNWLGEDKEVVSIFNKIGNGVTTSSDFYYNEECKKAFQHSKKPWNRIMANLIRNYFSSVWVGTSTVAAIILLLLTAIQTVLTFTGSI